MTRNKHKGSDFDEYLLEGLRENDELVFLHLKGALENPDEGEPGDYRNLIKSIADVAKARGNSKFVEKSGVTRQGLHKILNGKCVPSIQNVMALLEALGLKFSIERIGKVITEQAPANVLDVAQFVASLMPMNATYMKLQKIVYYSQAESLVHYDKPLFGERIEAWAAGPVVRELFEKHRGRKYLNKVQLGNVENLSLEQKACVRWAIEKYGNMDGDILSHLTHIEDPWRNARGSIAEDEPSRVEITKKAIRSYYSKPRNYAELDDSEK